MSTKKNKKNIGNLSLSIAENDPLYGCWINQEWKSAGYAYILVARKRKTGLIAFAAFWIDIVKGIIERCSIQWNCTEDFFQKNILKKNPEISFLIAESSLAKEIIEEANNKMQKNSKAFPENYSLCKKMLGLEEEKNQQEEEISVSKNLKFYYKISDSETIEADLRQIEVLEEAEDSSPVYRCFEWKEPKKRGFFSISKEKFFLGKVILEENRLLLEVFEEKNAQHLQDSLLTYLGTTVSLEKE